MAYASGHGRFRRDESGSVYLEFTVTMSVFLTVVLGFVDFGYIYFQWNAATKAAQVGGRLAAVSDPVWTNITALDGLASGVNPGDAWGVNYDCACKGTSDSAGTCSGTCPGGSSYSSDAMKKLVYGLPPPGNSTLFSCTAANIGMCDIYSPIRPENVTVRYQYTGLGYAGRPGGAVPTITVSLSGLTYNYFFLAGLLGFGQVNVPASFTTMTGEDLNSNGS